MMTMMLAVALTGCRHESLPETGKAIRFSVDEAAVVDLQTKADLPTEADFKNRDIALFGICTKSEAETIFDGSYDTSRLRFDSTKGWYYEPLKYWNKGGLYDFRAISPLIAAKPNGSAAKTGAVEADFNEYYDLMVASNHDTAALSSTDSVDPIQLTFSHACAAVRFKFTKGAETRDCKVTHFEVNKISTSGTMTYSWNGAKDVITWKPGGAKKEAHFTSDTQWEITETTDFQSFDGWHLVVPQTLNGATVTFQFKIGADATRTAVLPIPENSRWEPGKVYEYRINIDILTVGFSFTVEPWPTNSVTGSYTVR